MTRVLFVSFDDDTRKIYVDAWFKKGSYSISDAKNKSDAFKLLNQYKDIKLIIINMDMDYKRSLNVISYLKSVDSKAVMIATSNNPDFNIAREAFRQGVSDYLLKSELTSSYYKKLQGRLNENEIKNPGDLNEYISDLRSGKERFLKDILEADEIYNFQEAINKYNISFRPDNLILCYLWVDDFQTISEKYDGNTIGDFSNSVKKQIDAVIHDTCQGESVILSPQEYLLYLSLHYNDMESLLDNVYDAVTLIKDNLHDSMDVSVSAGISSLSIGDKNIREFYLEAKYNVKLRFVFGKGTIITPEISKMITPKKIDSIFGKEEKFIRTLIEADKEKAQYELEALLKLIRNSNPGRLDKIYSSYMEIIYIIIKFINEKCYDTVEVFGQNLDFYDIIAKFETQEEINEWIKDITDIVVTYLKEKRDVKVNRAILRVQEFIRNNYNNDLTLKMASDFVGLSESHLSNIFTKKTGQTFTDYLTSVRIEKAKELLETTNLKVYEVGVSIGYANVEHFSRVFKKFTGLSPNNYKNS